MASLLRRRRTSINKRVNEDIRIRSSCLIRFVPETQFRCRLMATGKTNPSKLRWGGLDEDDGEDLDFLLAPKQVHGPDENGIKKVIEYKFDEDGNRVKITTTTRVRKLAKARVSKRAMERRGWAKFGYAVHEDVGSRLPMVSTEEILLNDLERLVRNQKNQKWQEIAWLNMVKEVPSSWFAEPVVRKGTTGLSRCPYKDLAPQAEGFVDKPGALETSAAAAGTGKSTYVPPSMRAGAERSGGSDMRRRNDENSVRVTNLSEDTREPDLLELFRTFGPVTQSSCCD